MNDLSRRNPRDRTTAIDPIAPLIVNTHINVIPSSRSASHNKPIDGNRLSDSNRNKDCAVRVRPCKRSARSSLPVDVTTITEKPAFKKANSLDPTKLTHAS